MSTVEQLLFALGNRQVQFAIVFVVLLGCYVRLAFTRMERERLRDEAAGIDHSAPLAVPAYEESAGR